MTRRTLADPAPPPPAGNRRTQVLSLLRHADRSLSVAEVAEATDLHVNTARFHLDGLVDQGLAERTSEPRGSRGRPRILYTSVGPTPGPRSYELLAEMLTGFVSSLDDVGPASVELGRVWGRHLVERPAPFEHVDAREAVARVDRMMAAVGFQPETRETDGGTEVRLRHCPFREVAQKHGDVVCAIHRGLMQGALEELGRPAAVTSLEPWVTPHMCLARLEAAESSS